MDFQEKIDQENIKYKARLVVDGSNQECGVDYESAYSPVMKYETLRVLLSIAATNNFVIKYVDVETAYLNGTLERDVYMQLPQGLQNAKNKVLKLKKSLYGLPEAGRCWYIKLCNILKDCGMMPCKCDPCVFKRGRDEDFLIITFYVDDCLIIGKNVNLVNELINQLKHYITIKEISDQDKVTFLGIRIIKDEEGFTLDQEDFVKEVLNKFKMIDCHPVGTPGVASVNLYDFENIEKTNPKIYQEMLGNVGYLVTATRPDLAFTYSKLSQFSTDPRINHFQALKRVFRYLQGTKNVKLRINKDNGYLRIFADASWCVTKDSRSFAGYNVKIGNNLISWKSKKEKLVALSSMEAEFIALCESVCEGKWLKELIREIGFDKIIKKPTIVYTDSKSIIDWSKEFKITARNKHMMRKINFIREDIESQETELVYCKSQNLDADMLTKDVDKSTLIKHMMSMGIT